MTSSIAGSFATTTDRHPDRPAVITANGRTTYAELAARAGGVATAVREHGSPGDRVGLLLDHGVDMIAAILGTLAAGRCYVPLDPTYPRDRLRAMCERADPAVILAQSPYGALADDLGSGPRVLALEGIAGDTLRVSEVDPHSPAYILFTSGSTGQPKGVAQSHRNVLHGIGNHVTNLRIGPGDRTSLLTSFSFDMAVSDLFSAVLSGAAVVPVNLRGNGLAHLATVLADCAVTVYHSTPTVFRYLVDVLRPEHRLPSIRTIVLGGEQVNRTDLEHAARYFAPDCVLVNGYGTTEASFAVQNHLPATGSVVVDDVLPIGSPLRGYEILLLDERDGVGEMAIRSDYLALGYWQDPERTAERFSADGTVYRTGDLARRLPDGSLVYVGRSDRQAKIRGHRVELGEVEAHLAALPGVARAVAVARTTGNGAELTAYVQPATGTIVPAPRELQRQLAERLPGYLVPDRILVVPDLPLTTTGKVDVGALADLAPPADEEPATRAERLVAKLWCEILEQPAVGRRTGFFDVGGNSVGLARLHHRLRQEFGRDVPLVALLESPTVQGMAVLFEGAPAGLPSPVEDARLRAARRRTAKGQAS